MVRVRWTSRRSRGRADRYTDARSRDARACRLWSWLGRGRGLRWRLDRAMVRRRYAGSDRRLPVVSGRWSVPRIRARGTARARRMGRPRRRRPPGGREAPWDRLDRAAGAASGVSVRPSGAPVADDVQPMRSAVVSSLEALTAGADQDRSTRSLGFPTGRQGARHGASTGARADTAAGVVSRAGRVRAAVVVGWPGMGRASGSAHGAAAIYRIVTEIKSTFRMGGGCDRWDDRARGDQ